jgi:uncharacterized delta-60 repeat protein
MKKKSIVNRYRSKLILEELEARQLFSGGAEAVIPPPNEAPPATVIEVDANHEPVAVNQAQAPNPNISNATTTSITANSIAPPSPVETITRHEIAFVDTNVEGYQQLVDDLIQQNNANKQIEVVLLTANRDGLGQISETLKYRQGIDAIHIFSYGRDGAVELGGVWHNTLSLEAQSSQISQWTTALTMDADILLYGCNVAGNSDGELFVNRLSQLSGADVNASEDLTGNTALGGDWQLEYRDGNIETTVALSQTAQQNWAGLLDITTGLLGHWQFDANATDASGNNYSGTLTNGALIDTTAGTNKEGAGKLSLDGVNDYVDLSTHRANFTSLTQGTVAMWIKTTDTSAELFSLSDVADNNSLAALWVTASGKIGFDVWENNANLLQVDSVANINDGQWHHVAVTVGASGNKLYIDGVQASVTYVAGNAASTTFFANVTGVDVMQIGRNSNSGGGRLYYTGLLDDARVYNRALTAADIALLANDAPTLDSTKSPTLNAINEDAVAPLGAVGTLVSNLVDFASPTGQVDNVTDLDSSSLGIAVTAADTTNGTWWYSTNNGINWNALGAASNASSRLLAADASTRLYFQPNANYNGTLSNAITFRAWDQSTGTNGSTADTSVNGGITPFSSATDSASLTVNAVNDAPVNTIPNNRYTPLNTAVAFSSVGGNAIQISDDAGNNPVQVTLSVTHGTINLASTVGLTLVSGANGSSTFTYSGTVIGLNTALNSGVTFNPTTAYRGLAQITLTTNDLGNSGSGGVLSDTDNLNVHVGALVVTNLSDTINGDTSSISALVATDGGDGISLREAILAANATPNVSGPDYIYFNIAGAGPHVINLSTALPAINSPVIIDASSEPDFGGTPVVVLNGGGTIQDGIQLYGGSGGSTIRGLVIQNFTQDGIDIANSNGNTIVGNWIGLNATGTAAAGNVVGMNIWNSNNNIIGGSTPADRNVISGNTNLGINIATDNATSTGNQIRGNYIGTDHTGLLAVGNQNVGIYANAANNTIGGMSANQGNVISGTVTNAGISLGTAANNTLIAGNLIGLNATGTAALGNIGGGMTVESANNIIGGSTALAHNVISGNNSAGIRITGAVATGNIVTGNYIGTDTTGTQDINGTAKINGLSGIVIQSGASNNRIGTNADGNNDAAERNIISGNNWFGIEIIDSGTTNNVVQGNYIGTDVTGLVALGNSEGGVSFWNGAANNQVGSGIATARNIISGNHRGVYIANGVSNNMVQGNYIGLGADGTTQIGNTAEGVVIYGGNPSSLVTGNIIGTNADGTNDAGERNIISGNVIGILLSDSEVTGNTIAGNYIGTDVSGTLDRGNALDGVSIQNGANANTVGGTASTQRNIISGNNRYGVAIEGVGSNNNMVIGNYIGLNAAGTTLISNSNDGVFIVNGASNNTVGGATAAHRNVISGNSDGVQIGGSSGGANNNLIQGNFIGTDFTGSIDLGNNDDGVDIDNAALNNQVIGNLISGNIGDGIDLGDAGASTGTIIHGNWIGTKADGTSALGNSGHGILIGNGGTANNTLIGGSISGQGNTIAFNSGDGIYVAASTGVSILGNSIHSNAGLGIDLGANNVTPNDLGDTDSGANALMNFPVIYSVSLKGGIVTIIGEAHAGATLEFFKSLDPVGVNGQGKTLIGRETLPLAGVPGTVDSTAIQFSYTFTAGSLVLGDSVTATATSAANNTSEFAVNVAAQTPANTAPSFSVGDGHVINPISANADSANAVAIQSDGKIVTAGGLFNPVSNNDIVIARYNTDGTLDTTFGSGGIVINSLSNNADSLQAIAIQADGKIVVAGTASDGFSNNIVVLRYNVNGTLDTTFGTAGIATITFSAGDEQAYALSLQPDGKIVVAGSATVGVTDDFAVARLNANGSLDTTFNGSGKVTTAIGTGAEQIKDIAIQEDGKIVAVGYSHNGTDLDIAVVRYNADGSLDTSFDGDGKRTLGIGIGQESANAVALQADGKIVIAGLDGEFSTNSFTVVRFNTDGSLDTTFSGDGIASTMIGSLYDEAFGLAIQNDGKIVVAGESFNGSNNDVALLRLNTDGSLDTTFSFDGKLTTAVGTATDSARAIALQADGRIVLAGYATSASGDTAVIRYNTDGSLDLRFNLVTTLDATPTFAEGGSPVLLDNNVQVYDNELLTTGNFSGATLTLVRNGGANAQDIFTATGTMSALTQGGNLVVGGVTVGIVTTNSGGTLVLTFNTNATNALVNLAMQQIAYSNSSDAPPASVQINWSFNDGNTGTQGTGGAMQATGSTTVTVTPVNEVPVVATTGTNLAYTENDPATTVDGALTLTDPDTTNLAGATVSITSGFVSGQDVLAFADQNGITGSWNASTGVLTLSGTATVANYQTALRSVTYVNTSDNPSTTTRTVSFVVSDGSTNSNTATRNINITAVNDAPVLSGANNLTSITEDPVSNPGTLVSALISGQITDADAAASTGIAVIAVDNTNGSWWYTTNGGTTWLPFNSPTASTARLLTADANTRVGFIPNTNFVGTATITFRAWDQTAGTTGNTANTTTNGGTSAYSTATASSTITVTGINDAPTVGAGVVPSVTEDTTNPLGITISSMFSGSFNDPDVGSSMSGIVITANNALPAEGIWQYSTDNGTNWYAVGTITSPAGLTLNTATKIRFLPAADYNGVPTIMSLRALDNTYAGGFTSGATKVTTDASSFGGSTALSSSLVSISTNITAVNDAPVLGNTGVVSFPSTDENTVSTPMTVNTLLASALWSDVDVGALKGIAVTAVTGNGTWQYSTDGTNWTWASVSATNALLLDGTTLIRYQPNSNNGEVPTFQYRAWDQTTGIASTSSTPRFGNVTASGGTTAYSTQTGTANITVTNVNDAPLLDNTGTMALTTINEDQTNNAGQTIASIILSAGGDRITDVDAGAVEGIAISAITSGNGTWQYSIDGGTSWNAVGAVSDSAALLLRSNDLIRFNPNGQDGTIADFNFRAWDQTSGAAGTKVSVLSSGGTSAFSTLIETASLTVTAVNDAPTINAIVYANINEGGSVTITSARLQVLDVDNTPAQLVFTTTVIPTEGSLLLNGVALTANATFTQADIDAGLVTYQHSGSELNSDSFTFTVSDGAGGSIAATNYVITINPIDDAPTATNLNTAESYTEDSPLNLADITVSDADSATATAILTLSNPAAGSLNIATSGAVTSTYNTGTGIWTASGAIADVNTLLAGLTFTPSLNLSSNFTIATSVSDGTTTLTGSKAITGIAINDVPVVATTGSTLAYIENAAAIVIDSGLTVSDIDNANLVSATVSIASGFVSGQDVLAFVDQNGITGSWNASTGVLTLSGTATVANYQTALRSVTYVNTSDNPSTTTRTVSFVANDGSANSTAATRNISVAAVNDAPVNSIPSNRYTPINTAVTFSSSGGNAIQISDVDAGINPVQVTLSVTNGTINLASIAGLTLVSGANGSSALTYSGTVNALNTALNNGVTFSPTTNYRGLAQITLTTNDLGNSGSGVALSDTDTLKVHVGALVVTNLSDSINGDTSSISALVATDGGDGISLREAIIATNVTPNLGGPDYIYFDIAGAGPHVINLGVALPAIYNPVIIDASSEPDYGGTPVVVLNGGGIIRDGIQLYSGSGGSTIRGLVIQNFTQDGIDIANSNGNTIAGNWIGLNSTGTAAAGNHIGINIYDSDNNIIGGTSAADRNVISGNTILGINLSALADNNQIVGNYIGVTVNGTGALANGNAGIAINDNIGNLIGNGTNSGRNIISGNTNVGIAMANADNAVIRGNYIGTDISGTIDLGNGYQGIYIGDGSNGNIIGGTNAGDRNIISGNNLVGIAIDGANASGNSILGNYIGTDLSGTQTLANGAYGISITSGADNNIIGGAAVGARNLISGNAVDGIFVAAGSTVTQVINNYVGTDVTGTLDLGNGDDGIEIEGDSNLVQSNVISGNNARGVFLRGNANTVEGNLIGTNAGGAAAIANSQGGILLSTTASNNIIGGITVAQRNIISGNTGFGINVDGANVTGTNILGNYIGLSATGTAAIANSWDGIGLFNTNGNFVGNGTAAGRNVISGNTGRGITLNNADNNLIRGNYIGTDITGTVDLGNNDIGVLFDDGSSGNTLGGTSAGDPNLISGNNQNGVIISGLGATNNSLLGNYIGTNISGTAALGNSFNGIGLYSQANNNIIGGSAAGASNLLSGNVQNGIVMSGVGTNSNTVQGNLIGVIDTAL